MAFDQPTRNRLSKFVAEARRLLTEEFTRQFQHAYGMDPASGQVSDLASLGHVDDARRQTARLLRETMEHYLTHATASGAKARQEALARIVREQAFTVLNRLCALRMAEARGLLIESITKGYQSRGFQLYSRLAGTALGETGDTYRQYLFSLFDEFAVDLPVLFDRFSPQGRLFPKEATLLHLLDEINHPDIDPLWAEDETIGWIYQYFNSKEERKAMRDASAAPRNSRELAVRNQFFTPRYVVEFLTDNTLGRIWYEMTQGQTALADACRYLVRRPTEIFLAEGEAAPEQEAPSDDLSQEELLKQPVYVPFRPLKDPRDLKMLDPACGSMHFGLYAFDLFERIYEEAWDLEEARGAEALARPADLKPLRETYPDQDAFLRDVPRLILERNIHGIDIDPRAVQIAGLSLWLRAQRSWHAAGVRSADRPAIRRSNVVTAEPMPGEEAMLEEFLKGLREDRLETLIQRVMDVPEGRRVRATPAMVAALGNLIRTVWEEMKLAGEAGSLLKIEEALVQAIREGRAEWEEKLPLFRVTEFGLTETKPTVRYLRTIPGEEADFWDRAEALALAALEDYAVQAENGQAYQRRLFADDAARGFAFIDLCRGGYDVVLMNPPFGQFSNAVKLYAKTNYPYSSNDVLAAFVERFYGRMSAGGILGAITSRTGFYITSFSKWRREFIQGRTSIKCFADLGQGVMDEAMVEASAYCLSNRDTIELASPFIRLLSRGQRSADLLNACVDIHESKSNEHVFWTRQSTFSRLSQAPFVYWISAEIASKLANHGPIAPDIAEVRQGLATADDPRFVRTLWEVPPSSIRNSRDSQGDWVPYIKGGSSQPWFSPVSLVVNWKNNAGELWNNVNSKGDVRSNIWMLRDAVEKYFFRPGFSWTRRAVRFIPYVTPDGAIPSASRYLAYPAEGQEYAAMGVAASNVASAYLRFYGEWFSRPNYMVEVVKTLPWPKCTSEVFAALEAHVVREVQQRRLAFRRIEPFQEFLSPLSVSGSCSRDSLLFSRESLLGSDLDVAVAEAYGLDHGEFAFLLHDLMEAVRAQYADVEDDDDTEENDATTDEAPGESQRSAMSYGFGCALGRWDIRYATGEKSAPEMPDAFAPLPVCPPGMLQNAQGLPAAPEDVPADYPLRISWGGVLVDDEGHPEDLVGRVREAALRVIWKDRADAIEQEAGEVLGVRSLRDYFSKPAGFFADHLKRYSKSRRQAPIYWPLSTPSGAYTLWLYYHRLTDQTLYTCVNDFVQPKLKQVQEEAARLRQRSARSSRKEKELERLNDLELELQDFQAELLRLAPIWKPDLNDGVQITAAPLWRLFQHRPWQKRLKETWEKLEDGDYDWAHLAYSLWPERVREKCRTDKSLAIAHGLEELYVELPATAKKRGRKVKAADPELELDNDD